MKEQFAASVRRAAFLLAAVISYRISLGDTPSLSRVDRVRGALEVLPSSSWNRPHSSKNGATGRMAPVASLNTMAVGRYGLTLPSRLILKETAGSMIVSAR